jgi:hypothetical protein
MKIKNLLIVLCLSSFTAQSQVSFGVNAGANMGSMANKYDGKKDKTVKSAVGYIIAGDVNIPLGEHLVFQTGLQWESLHTKANEENVTSTGGYTYKDSYNSKSSLNFINIPVKIYYKIPVGTGSFMVGAGPYLGIGISGKSKGTSKTEFTYAGTTNVQQYDFNEKVVFGSADTAVKRTNFGVGVNLSYTMANNIRLSLYSNFGLANINNADKSSSKASTYGITIGYVFGNKNDEE